MAVTIRSEIRYWPNASRIDDCTQNFLTIPKSLISETYNPPPASIVNGRVLGLSVEPDKEIMEGVEFSSAIKEMKMDSRLVIGQEKYDYLFIFEKDWKKLSKRFLVPGRKYVTYMVESVIIGKKKEKVFHGNTVYWEEKNGSSLDQ